jgi:hypothetical protein
LEETNSDFKSQRLMQSVEHVSALRLAAFSRLTDDQLLLATVEHLVDSLTASMLDVTSVITKDVLELSTRKPTLLPLLPKLETLQGVLQHILLSVRVMTAPSYLSTQALSVLSTEWLTEMREGSPYSGPVESE